MIILKPIRFLFILGNFLLLFRNISFKSRGTRYIIYCIIISDITLSIFNSIACFYFNLYKRFSDVLHLQVTLINSIVLIILSIYHSKKFKNMLYVLNSNNDFMENDDMYLKKLERKRKMFFLVLILYVGVKIIPSLIFSRYYSSHVQPNLFFIILKINALFWDARFFYEYLLMCALLYTFSEQLECIIRSVVRQKRFIARNFDISDTSLHQLVQNQYLKKLSEWSEAFSYVEEAIKLFNGIFGIQFSIMISSTIFYVTSFLYEMTDLIVNRHIDIVIVINYLSRIIIFHIQIFILSRTGQILCNNVEHLKRCVAKIFILSLADDKFYKATEDFLDHISSGETRIQAFGSIDIKMSLAPTFIMLYTSYTILALQFNNIV
nr:gustatory receptor 35 [Papilio xuthus]